MKLDINGRLLYELTDSSTGKNLTDYLDVKQVIVHMGVNKMPNIQVNVVTPVRLDYYDKFSDVTIKLKSSDEFDISYPFGIAKINSLDNYHVELKGYMCKRSDFMDLGSEYLGESLSDSISALEIRDTVNNVDSISGDYWRINETKVECLLRLLPGARPNSIFNISESDINVIQLDSSSNSVQNDYMPPAEVVNMIASDRFNESNYSMYEPEDEETANKAVPMFNAMWNSLSIVGYEHLDFVNNFMSSLRFKYPVKMVMKFRYNNTYIPYNPGEVMKLNVDDYNYNSMLILAKDILYNIEGGTIMTELILGTID